MVLLRPDGFENNPVLVSPPVVALGSVPHTTLANHSKFAAFRLPLHAVIGLPSSGAFFPKVQRSRKVSSLTPKVRL